MSEEYNGWTNWETWRVNLWITNDQLNQIRAVEEKGPQELREWWEDEATEGLEGFVVECVNGVLSEVNWKEIYDGLHEGDEE